MLSGSNVRSNPISTLNELCQRERWPPPRYEDGERGECGSWTVVASLPDPRVLAAAGGAPQLAELRAAGSGPNKQSARAEAAAALLAALCGAAAPGAPAATSDARHPTPAPAVPPLAPLAPPRPAGPSYKNLLQEALSRARLAPRYATKRAEESPDHAPEFHCTASVIAADPPGPTSAGAGGIAAAEPPSLSGGGAAPAPSRLLGRTGEGRGSRKIDAEQAAARQLLERVLALPAAPPAAAGANPAPAAAGGGPAAATAPAADAPAAPPTGAQTCQQPLPLPQPPPKSRPAVQELRELVTRAAWCLEPLDALPTTTDAPITAPDDTAGTAGSARGAGKSGGGPAPGRPAYEARVIINGRLLAAERGRSKQDARHAAAAAALACMGLGPFAAAGAAAGRGSPAAGGGGGGQPLAARVQAAALAKLRELAARAGGAGPGSTVLCAFVLERPAGAGAGASTPGAALVAGAAGTERELPPAAAASGSGNFPPPGQELPALEVVSLATGTGFCGLPLGQLAEPASARGTRLMDSHAEALARRGLLRWLYAEAERALGGGGGKGGGQQQPEDPPPALERAPPPPPPPPPPSGPTSGGEADENASAAPAPRLRRGLRLHMYISKPPCGDAAVFDRPPPAAASYNTAPGAPGAALPHYSRARPRARLRSGGAAGLLLPSAADVAAHWPHNCSLLDPRCAASGCGLLRAKMLGGESCSPLPQAAAPAASAEAAPGSGGGGAAPPAPTAAARLRKACCSDKLCRWNALGLQGALLGRLVAPVYMESLTIGGPADDFNTGAVCRAVCCRLAPDAPAPGVEEGAGRGGGGRAPCFERAAARGLVLPPPFRVNHPTVTHAAPPAAGGACPLIDGNAGAGGGFLLAQLPVAGGHGKSSSDDCLNWNAGDGGVVETTSGGRGTLVHASGGGGNCSGAGWGGGPAASRLCKAALLERFERVAALAAGGSTGTNGGGAAAPAVGGEAQGLLAYEEPGAAAGGWSGWRSLDSGEAGSGSTVAATALPQPAVAAAAAPAARRDSYREAKGRNEAYAAARAALYAHFERAAGQRWRRRAALVPGLEDFGGG